MLGGLLAREDELAAVSRTIAGAMDGTGAVLVLEGPAGIGKTAVLEAAREAAGDALVLHARASELDRGFGFGLVHQLLDRAATPELMTGAAAHAGVVLDPAAGPAEDAGFAVLHGLYWLTANLADTVPVVLLADDLHWADVPSLRFLEYLARRIDGLRVALIATTRPNEPGAANDLLDELRASATVMRPRPLDREAAAAMLPAEVVDAALEATGGNPLLLSVLAREVAGTDAVTPEQLAELGARGVAPTVERRLRPLGPDAVAAARAVAVLGERATADDIAAIASLNIDVVTQALDRLNAVDVLDGRAFVHPLVRAAVLDAMPAGERAALHRAAAVRLRERGLRAGAVAPHWHAAEPAGDARAVADLRAAAAEAAAEGATDLAADHLTRALAEMPANRVEIALALGELEVRAQRPTGQERLRALLREGLDGDAAARAHAALANHLVHTDPVAAVVELEQATEDAADPALRLRLEAGLLEALLFVDPDGSRLRARIARGLAQEPPSIAALAAAANDGALRGMPTDELVPLAERALAGGELLATVGPASSTWNLVTHALRFAEDARGAERALEAGDRAVREQGLFAATLFVEQAWGYWHRDFGSVALGAARSRSGLEAIRAQGMVTTVPALSAVLAENLIELDKLEEAAAEVDVDLGAAAHTFIEPFVLTTRGRVRFLLRRLDEAETDLRRVVAFCDARDWTAPNAALGRLRLAEVLAVSGQPEEALELMEHDVAAAQAAQRPGCTRDGAAPARARPARAAGGDRDAPRGRRGAGRHGPATRARLGAARPRRTAAHPRRPGRGARAAEAGARARRAHGVRAARPARARGARRVRRAPPPRAARRGRGAHARRAARRAARRGRAHEPPDRGDAVGDAQDGRGPSRPQLRQARHHRAREAGRGIRT